MFIYTLLFVISPCRIIANRHLSRMLMMLSRAISRCRRASRIPHLVFVSIINVVQPVHAMSLTTLLRISLLLRVPPAGPAESWGHSIRG